MLAPHGFDGLRPEGIGADAPGALEHVGQDEHRHVAAHAVALPGDAFQLADHRLLQVPDCRSRVAACRASRRSRDRGRRRAPAGHSSSARGSSSAAREPGRFGAVDEVVRMLVDPGVIRRHVVRHEVEHQPQLALAQPLPQSGERRLTAQIAMDRIALDGEPGAGDVFVGEVGQCIGELAAPFCMCCARSPGPPGRSARRSATRPSRSPIGDTIQLGVGNVVERRAPARARETTRSARREC